MATCVLLAVLTASEIYNAYRKSYAHCVWRVLCYVVDIWRLMRNAADEMCLMFNASCCRHRYRVFIATLDNQHLWKRQYVARRTQFSPPVQARGVTTTRRILECLVWNSVINLTARLSVYTTVRVSKHSFINLNDALWCPPRTHQLWWIGAVMNALIIICS